MNLRAAGVAGPVLALVRAAREVKKISTEKDAGLAREAHVDAQRLKDAVATKANYERIQQDAKAGALLQTAIIESLGASASPSGTLQ
jgi:hypothetical protein